jgi:hypothetical protein
MWEEVPKHKHGEPNEAAERRGAATQAADPEELKRGLRVRGSERRSSRPLMVNVAGCPDC